MANRRKSVKVAFESNAENFRTDIVKEVIKLINEWNELALKYKGGPKGMHIPAQVTRCVFSPDPPETITPSKLGTASAVIELMYDFIKENDDWKELWNEIIVAINESEFLQGKTDSSAVRPSLGWIFMKSKIHGMDGEHKYKGMQLILSGKYANGIGESEGQSTPQLTDKEFDAAMSKGFREI